MGYAFLIPRSGYGNNTICPTGNQISMSFIGATIPDALWAKDALSISIDKVIPHSCFDNFDKIVFE
jgi:hypothetical protein